MSELRSCRMEIRNVGEDADGHFIDGYASTWEQPSEHDWHGTTFTAETFREDLERGDPLISKWLHGEPFGMVTSRAIDEVGLPIRITPVKTAENDERMRYVNAGVVRGLSITFRRQAEEVLDYRTPWGAPVIQITKARLAEISPVMDPSNPFARMSSSRHFRQLESGAWIPDQRSPKTYHINIGSSDIRAELLKTRDAFDALAERLTPPEKVTPDASGLSAVLASIDQINAREEHQRNS